GVEVGELDRLLGEELARLQLEQGADQDEELPARVEVEPLTVGQSLDEGDDDVGDVDVSGLQLLAEDQRQQEVERALERVEIELELADVRHARRLAARADAAARDRHRRPLRDGAGLAGATRGRPVAALTPDELPPDEERAGADADDDRDPEVQPLAEEVLRGVDAKELLERAPERVEGDVEREQPGRSNAEPGADPDQDAGDRDVVDQLVQEGRVEGLRERVLRRPVLGVDLEAPRQVGRLPEELLVEPVADP